MIVNDVVSESIENDRRSESERGGGKEKGQQSIIQYLDVNKFQRHLLRFIIDNHVPLTILEDDNFR
jgi:hypothetical protein